ncbi:transferring glycosyl group transferase [Trifolium repens]|nr:transferring glycosyl group transferase [Trifolium repens]
MSSSSVESVRELLNKPWKTIPFPTIKSSDLFSLFLKVGLAISTIFLISHLFYLSLNYHQPQNHYDQLALKEMFQRRTPKTLIIDSGPAEQPAAAVEEPTKISHVLFGIGGSYVTWNTRHFYSELWWRQNVTRGFVWIDKEPPINETWPETSLPYKVSADTSSFKYTCWYGSRSAIRIARILKESFELGLDNVRWFVMGDDDTVFFTDNLITVLSKYDHNQMYYIGGNSESVEQDVIHFYTMAYGGGGFAISYPLAAELVKILDGCIDRYSEYYGSDQKVQSCISEIGVQITKEPGFHQVDIRGNPYGLLAAHPVAPLVSLHHLDYVDSIFPNMPRVESVKRLMTGYKLDPGRTVQQTFCYDHTRNWSVSVSWGYSVELYPFLLRAKDLETAFRTFKTWRSWSDGPFTFNTRPVSGDPCEKPLVYFMDRVVDVGEGLTRSGYTRNDDVSGKVCERDDYLEVLGVEYINVSAPLLLPNYWKEAPRRQCCEIINDADSVDNVVNVKIRGCQQFESVTPR